MSKISLTCTDFRPLRRNTLRGFATIQIAHLRTTMREVAIHDRDGKTWAQPPSRPWTKNGQLFIGNDGKTRYSPLFEFDSPAVRGAFSDAVIRAIRQFAPSTLEHRERVA